jgi:hypothetical protein
VSHLRVLWLPVSDFVLVYCDSWRWKHILTLSICADYCYSAASHASCPDGVLVLCDFHKVLKWAGKGDFKVQMAAGQKVLTGFGAWKYAKVL